MQTQPNTKQLSGPEKLAGLSSQIPPDSSRLASLANFSVPFPQCGAWSEATVPITHQYQSQFGHHGGEPGRNWTS